MRAVRARQFPASPSSAVRRRLMVVEAGASLACRDDAAEFDETTAITQLSGEPAADLAQRALARIALAERSGQAFDSALLVVGESGASSARRLIALGLAAHARASHRLSELVVLAPADASAELREELLMLADELLFGAEQPLPVRLCVATQREAEQRSGTFWCIPERDSGTE
ncbi:MAG: hypothetical protein EOO73_32135 [Myxococcales bacterium]|nr:MAG: hypothetical protein EOO73_32135 [Myxococcales bacterium]